MKHNYDHLQLRALCYTAALAPASHLVPKVTASIAGSGSWIAPLIALPVILIFVLLLSGLMNMRRDGEGLGELILRTGGSGFGSIALILLAAFMIFDGGLLLRTAAGRFTDTIFPSSGPWFFIFIMLAMGTLAALGSVKALPRAARVFAPILTAILLLTLIFSFSSVDKTRLLPVSRSDTAGLFLSSLVVVEIYAGILTFAAVLEDQCPRRRGRFKSHILWSVLICLLLTVLSAVIIGSYGAKLTSELSSPFFSMIRDVTLFRTVERIEALVAALWVMSDFTLLALLLISSGHLLRLVLGHKPERSDVPILSMANGRWLIPVCAALAAAVAAFIPSQHEQLDFLSQYIVPAVNLCAAFILLPVCYAIAYCRRSKPR